MKDAPKDDVWTLLETDKQSQYYTKSFRFDFTYIDSHEIKNIIKGYVWSNHIAQTKTLSKLYNDVSRFKIFNDYAKIRSIKSLLNCTNLEATEFRSYLSTTISKSSKVPLSYAYQASVFSAFKTIVCWCQIHEPRYAPKTEIFSGYEYSGQHRKLTVEFIPDDVLSQINVALKTEENPYLKNGIIILESTGMRIGDLTQLTIDCLQTDFTNGHTITWFDHKTRKIRRPLPVRPECAEAIEELIKITSKIRKSADESVRKYLFLHEMPFDNMFAKKGTILRVEPQLMRSWLRKFAKRSNITNSDGKPYKITCHQFRRTLATDMLSKGVNINVIQDVLGHANPITTKRHYADIKDKERAEVFRKIGVIGNIRDINEDIIQNPDELEWFKANRDGCIAGLCDGYCTKPFKDGEICERLLKRQKCYTCSRYITTPEYLEAHRGHLRSLEQQLENNIYGEHYASHFISTIEVLKVIISRLEVL